MNDRAMTTRSIGLAAFLLLLSMAGLASHSLAIPPPQMPPKFDRQTVQQLVDGIEQEQNATILKFGYFIRRNPNWLPLTEGLEMVRSAAKKEPITSKRWFLLQQVRAFAAPRLGESTWQEGLEAYQVSLSQFEKAKDVGAEEILERTVYEFVSAVGSKAMWDLSGISGSRAALQQALRAHLEYLKTHDKAPFNIEWDRAIQLVRGVDELKTVVQTALPDLKQFQTQNFDLLLTAAIVLSYSDARLALEVLDRAEPLLNQTDTDGKAAFYDRRIDLLRKLKRIGDAVAEQKKRVAETGGGYATLVQLLQESKDDKAVEEILNHLKEPQAKESEVLATAHKLWQMNFRRETITLLKGYLEVSRTRFVEQELEARVLLIQAYLDSHKWDEAHAVAQASQIKPPLPTTKAQTYYEALQSLPAYIVQRQAEMQAAKKQQ